MHRTIILSHVLHSGKESVELMWLFHGDNGTVVLIDIRDAIKGLLFKGIEMERYILKKILHFLIFTVLSNRRRHFLP